MIITVNNTLYYAMGNISKYYDCLSCELPKCNSECKTFDCNYFREKKQLPKKAKRWTKK